MSQHLPELFTNTKCLKMEMAITSLVLKLYNTYTKVSPILY